MGRLIISRKANETLVLDGPGEVSVVKIKGNRVVLSIDAPRTTNVRRAELVIVSDQLLEPGRVTILQSSGRQSVDATLRRDALDLGTE